MGSVSDGLSLDVWELLFVLLTVLGGGALAFRRGRRTRKHVKPPERAPVQFDDTAERELDAAADDTDLDVARTDDGAGSLDRRNAELRAKLDKL